MKFFLLINVLFPKFCKTLIKVIHVLDFAPYWTTGGSNVDENVTDSLRKKSNSRTGSPDIRQFLTPLPMHIAYDLKYVRIFKF